MFSLLDIAEEKVRMKMLLIKTEILKEMEAQGHVLTGKLRDSLEFEIHKRPLLVEGIMYLEEYGRFVDQGVAPGRVPFEPVDHNNPRGGTSEYISALAGFFEKRGLGEKEALGAAFATANKASQTGHPTPGAFDYTNNGRRQFFFTGTLERLEDEILSLVTEVEGASVALFDFISDQFTLFGDIVLRVE